MDIRKVDLLYYGGKTRMVGYQAVWPDGSTLNEICEVDHKKHLTKTWWAKRLRKLALAMESTP